jgi:mono/diheme cytochrome c family protein
MPSATITYGEAFFLNECARCHGDRGQGNPEKDVPRLRNNTYDFSEVRNSIDYPEGIMPEFEDVPDSIIVQIVEYLNNN